jgi:hypothetical protein
MGVIIRVILMFLFIQFVVLITVMAVSLLLVRHEVPVLGRETGQEARGQSFAFVMHLPRRVLRSVVHRAQSMHLPGVH